MKKIISLIIAIVLVAVLAVPVLAAETSDSLVKFNVEERFTIVIPPTVDLTSGSGTVDVSMEGKIANDNRLDLTISAVDAWTLKAVNDNSVKIDYSVTMDGDPVNSGDVILSMRMIHSEVDATLCFEVPQREYNFTGTFTDVITFTATINPVV